MADTAHALTEAVELVADAAGRVQRGADVEEVTEMLVPASVRNRSAGCWARLRATHPRLHRALSVALTLVGRWLVLFDVVTDVGFALGLRRCGVGAAGRAAAAPERSAELPRREVGIRHVHHNHRLPRAERTPIGRTVGRHWNQRAASVHWLDVLPLPPPAR